MKQCMIDLETFGTKPGCVIRSIGAVMFDPQGGVGKEFYANITESSCLEAGLTKDKRTEKWWSEQSAEAQAVFTVDPKPLASALAAFGYWFKGCGEQVWAQGAAFDFPIIEAAFNAVGQVAPWKFWNVRDTRTAYDLYRFDPKSVPRAGTYHNALDDAKHQVLCIQTAVKNLNLQSADVFA